MKHQNTHFQNPQIIKNWIMLSETSLQWIEWLQSAEMPHKDPERCPKKFPNIMCLMKRISGRTRGVGLKTTKFHCILQMPEDMMAHGGANGGGCSIQ